MRGHASLHNSGASQSSVQRMHLLPFYTLIDGGILSTFVLLEKYSDAYYALDSANRPASLTLNKSNFSTQANGHSLKQTYTVTASYDVNGLDLLAE
jgi:hypothetical protein